MGKWAQGEVNLYIDHLNINFKKFWLHELIDLVVEHISLYRSVGRAGGRAVGRSVGRSVGRRSSYKI